MLIKILFVIPLLLFNFHTLNADDITKEKKMLTSLNQGIKATEKFLEKVPTYELYDQDKTILHYAVELDKYDIVEFLVSKNIELSRKGGIYYQTALQDAIFYQYFRIAKLLINSGTDLNIKNIDGDTALHIAASNGYTDMVNLLLANGASKKIYNSNGDTPYDLIPEFMMNNSKKLKAILKTDVNSPLERPKGRNSADFSLDSMEYGSATFTLDRVNFEGTSVGDDEVSSSSKGITIDVVDKDTIIENSNLGSVIKSN